ncbi:unnamed protein product [marine sediment metagenome]|uniref:SpoVT-AbrB domain-containing protein n=1 Tax=marine sediment metagenome TaxID=412755 RepID=X1EXN9_9ZZZZ
MEKPYRYQKKLLKSGNSLYALVPQTWARDNGQDVIIEVYKDKIIITPVPK